MSHLYEVRFALVKHFMFILCEWPLVNRNQMITRLIMNLSIEQSKLV